jgi:hypothetical protein
VPEKAPDAKPWLAIGPRSAIRCARLAIMSAPRPHRRLAAMLAALSLLLCAGVLVYYELGRGPGRTFVRGAIGDVLVVAFLYFGLAALTRWRPRTRLLAVGGLAIATELSQLVPRSVRSAAVELTIGATFDPWDLVCYAVGLGLAWLLEAQVIRRLGAGPGAGPPADRPSHHRNR